MRVIKDLDPWYYVVPIGSAVTVPGRGSKQSPEELQRRQAYRYRVLVKPVLDRYDFKRKTVADVACNCAFWSSQYVTYGGADRVMGFEGRMKYVKQAELYWNTNGFLSNDRVSFRRADVNTDSFKSWFEESANADFTLLAGILYHVTNYKSLLRAILRGTKEAVVVDTRVSPDEKKITEPGGWHFDGVGVNVVKCNPSVSGMAQIIEQEGYTFEVLPHAGPVPEEMKYNDDYEIGKRVAIFARRK